ncbi:Retron-type RNA-directed DNA polymerase [Dehalobacter sp. UNSWDHB]|jgi:Retron-type reverse transcriptase|uniref:group II intron reverse transcriptase/maturase n=1 Tax=unclassified Dehalobacter TaxID=2635733 RepID=UPI00028B86D2|nr:MULTISPECIES: group II intron reverse transcriptase/maturase [unclassified Dehalobacter]AFV01916.1 Retron-type reverse transcriptase [Dehalobacter sp. DCA]AFV02729.1 RNA-directed DNA polymerase (Reverse transcriptase) [Dehalobacter sp. DCA]AFV05714.1 Retron-type reverse transcriptase [Dehalobacter sp. CF]EQB20007.1 Retron-type RNA-directed DNA polymerase [Dehalobacter sp. UNSWDHB]EQB20217.1 Retron-type RNA-directed DNA polymerase [Dehalobacter sp. UNSWDHB]
MQLAKETSTGQAGSEKLMRTSLQGIAQKAKRLKSYRFRNLYRMLNYSSLTEAWKTNNKKAAAGVDKVTAKEFAEELKQNIENLAEHLEKKRYRAKLLRRVDIPKGEGKTRPLGIPAIADKLVQSAAAKILEAIYEQDFLASSYGYRPKISAHTAIKDLSKELNYGDYSYIVEADIKGFFQNIDHAWLIRMLEQRIDDKAFLGLIKKWLKAGILKQDGEVEHPITGSPQGGIISPILANTYLHYVLDLWFEKIVKPNCEGEAYLCRYCDDFVCAFQYKGDADKFYRSLPKRLEKFGLELAVDKTQIIQFNRWLRKQSSSFEYLGFEFRWGVSRRGKTIITRRTARKRLRKSLANFKEWCRENRNKRLRRLFPELNSKLRGYYNYYGLIGNSGRLREFYEQAMKTLYKWLNRRSQRKSFDWSEFNRVLKRYGVLTPRIVETNQKQLSFGF